MDIMLSVYSGWGGDMISLSTERPPKLSRKSMSSSLVELPVDASSSNSELKDSGISGTSMDVGVLIMLESRSKDDVVVEIYSVTEWRRHHPYVVVEWYISRIPQFCALYKWYICDVFNNPTCNF